MNLPLEITPNPLIATTVEIRFNANLSSNEILNKVYKQFSQTLPNLEVNQILKQLRTGNSQFNQPWDYILSNDLYKIMFSETVLIFDHVSEYQLWNKYFQFIKEIFNPFVEILKIEKINRIGVRYGSIFENENDINKILEYTPKWNIPNYSEEFENSRFLLKKNNINLWFQVFKNATAIKKNRNINGICIDIDAYFLEDLVADEKILDRIDELHSAEKELFYKIIKNAFLNTLNPRYC